MSLHLLSIGLTNMSFDAPVKPTLFANFRMERITPRLLIPQ
jgi:hypothetical protein